MSLKVACSVKVEEEFAHYPRRRYGRCIDLYADPKMYPRMIGHSGPHLLNQHRLNARPRDANYIPSRHHISSVMIDTKEYTGKLISLCRYFYEST